MKRNSVPSVSSVDYSPTFSVEDIPGIQAKAVFTQSTSEVFKEDVDTVPIHLDDNMEFMPWGEDNNMPFKILDLIEKDETLSTCQLFNAEVCYGSGLQYNTDNAEKSVKSDVEDFLLDNDLPSYFLGVCQDLKHFAFTVSVIFLNADASRIVRIVRKEACYCRFAPVDKKGHIPYVLFANWRKYPLAEDVERIELLDCYSPWTDLKERLSKRTAKRKFAVLTRVPTVDSTYYPIPYYASLFKGQWYKIKQLIGIAKQAKLKNSAPIKYHIEISARFWDGIFKAEGITDRKKQPERDNSRAEAARGYLRKGRSSPKARCKSTKFPPTQKRQYEKGDSHRLPSLFCRRHADRR